MTITCNSYIKDKLPSAILMIWHCGEHPRGGAEFSGFEQHSATTPQRKQVGGWFKVNGTIPEWGCGGPDECRVDLLPHSVWLTFSKDPCRNKGNYQNIKEWKNSTCWLVLVVILKLWFSVLLKLRSHIITHYINGRATPSIFWDYLRLSTTYNGYKTSKYYGSKFKFLIITH